MAGSNYVAYNLAQSRDESEKLQGRNNIGAAGLASLAASFESRAPSYNWSAGEVCTYGGKLWQFDSDHSGAWTGADAHEIDVASILKSQIVNLTNWVDITSKLGTMDAGVQDGRVVILYNKALEQVDVSFWALFSSSSSNTRKIFNFKQDIPALGTGSEQQTPGNYVFGGDILGRVASPSLLPQLASVRPYIAVDSLQSNSITFRGGVTYSHCDSFWRVLQVSKNLVGAFNEYLGL